MNDGKIFNLSKVTLDGLGKNIRQGIRYKGSGTVDDVIIQNMVYPGYAGWGIAQGWTTTTAMNLTVTNSTFTNFGRVGILIDEGSGPSTATISGNTFTGKGVGDHLDYAVEVGGGAQATISNNTISNCAVWLQAMAPRLRQFLSQPTSLQAPGLQSRATPSPRTPRGGSGLRRV